MPVFASEIKGPRSVRSSIPPGSMNKLQLEDRAAHDWYRFVLSFPPHLVSDYLRKFEVTAEDVVVDPFCGTGTTLVECKKHGIASIGVEANPMAHFASTVKTTWDASGAGLLAEAQAIARTVRARLESDGVPDDHDLPLFGNEKQRARQKLLSLPPEKMHLLLSNSISPVPLHKALVLLDQIDCAAGRLEKGFFRLALASALVQSIGNLHFGPEVGVGPPKQDAAAVVEWLGRVNGMAADLTALRPHRHISTTVLHADARNLAGLAAVLGLRKIAAVITSPPYPNEKDYTRTTRLESVILGFISDKAELQSFKRKLMRSNTRNVYKGDDDGQWVASNARVQELATRIESRRLELEKTSGFERMYAKVAELYFGGMARHFAVLRPFLKPGAMLAYVVGDQASFFQIMIRTGTILAEIAESLGYDVVGLDLFRTRLATATRQQLREEVLVLRWPGGGAR
ncbi:MAG: DNA methyltransferase [Phycisphaerae bacterium]|nr:DNA methyltransferase [Phycisphaerae bacterium]